MAIPAIYLSFAMVVLGSLAALGTTIAERTIGTINHGSVLAQVSTSAAATALSSVRNQIASAPAGTLPTLTAPQSTQSSSPGLGAYTTTYNLQAYASTSLGGASTTISQSVEKDTVDDSALGGTAATNAIIAPRYTLQIDVTTTAPDGSTSDRRQICVLRTYPQAPFADFVSCTPIAANGLASQIATDASGDRSGPTDTSVHSYDTCKDTSSSGACTKLLPVDRSTTTTTTGTASGAAQIW